MEDDVREDSLSLFGEVLRWRLVGDRWHAVHRSLDDLATALARGDSDAFREVLCELELAGPVRVVPVEGASDLPVPERVRERINQLVHALEDVDRIDRRPEGTEDTTTAR
ncbi:CATRA system-associated protein [Saccharothrix sp. HUAS TT1]|uniref:CATRA system-associated protein n=1 Tax=unclassified Saccharothrix TaxID=2593673 RepID=UPI00345C4EB1